MNDQAQMAAVLLAGFFATGDPVPPEAGLAGADMLASRAKPEIVEISSGSCAIVTAHQPREDVAYKSGVTINGSKTVPADVNTPFVHAPRPIYEFDVRIDPLPNSNVAVTPRLEVATVTYEPANGRIMLDGQELVWMHENALRAACESHTRVTP